MDNTAFYKCNQLPIKNTFEMAVTKRFCDKQGNPIMWKFHKLETHFERQIKKKCQQPSLLSVFGIGKARYTTDSSKLWIMRLTEACVFPDLKDKKLQAEHNANNEYELFDQLVKDDQEYSALIIRYYNEFMKGEDT